MKRVEKMVLSRDEQDLARQLDGEKDPGISFEETGIDYLAIDEGHSYKNLRTVSNIPGAAIEGSQTREGSALEDASISASGMAGG